jgi:CRISPR-associated protein Cmr3
MTSYCFLEPLDVLLLRGNKLFGDPGSYGESLVPPWPSVAAGALRSRLLADDGVDPAEFAAGRVTHPELGTPEQPGSFAVTAFQLARRRADGRVEVLVAPPADLVVKRTDNGDLEVCALTPTPLPSGEGQWRASIQSSAPLPLLPVLAETTRGKPAGGYWLGEGGWRKYLAGEVPEPVDLVESSELWQIDARVGVGLDPATRRASDGRLFSVQAVAMVERGHRIGTDRQDGKLIVSDYDVGFVAGVTGSRLPHGGTARLGGDGRAAAIRRAEVALLEPDYEAIAQARRCRIVLATPGIFPDGWRLPGMAADGGFDLSGVSGRVACAAVPRAEVVSGWDLAAWSQGKGGPKPARRAAPSGSVYWIEALDASAEQLRKLVADGLWPAAGYDATRRCEGFNRLSLAAWS